MEEIIEQPATTKQALEPLTTTEEHLAQRWWQSDEDEEVLLLVNPRYLKNLLAELHDWFHEHRCAVVRYHGYTVKQATGVILIHWTGQVPASWHTKWTEDEDILDFSVHTVVP